MNVNGTLINYYFHCKRQCYLFGNRLNLEDNSENVKIGKAIHELKQDSNKETELAIDNIKIDRLTKEYLVELKKSDADIEASKWQLLYYLKVLRGKGIERRGKLEFVEKNKEESKIVHIELTDNLMADLETHIANIQKLLNGDEVPEALKNKSSCRQCAYYEYCYI